MKTYTAFKVWTFPDGFSPFDLPSYLRPGGHSAAAVCLREAEMQRAAHGYIEMLEECEREGLRLVDVAQERSA